MGRKERGQNYILMQAAIVLSLICLCMYGIQGIYGFSLFPDEFGYWASAASFLGYDFSQITSIGSFYSFGYSLILTPIIKIFSDSIIAYRAAVVINLCLQVVSFFLIRRILDKVLPDADKTLKMLLAGAAVLYPSWVFYTQMTMSEALLFFMYTVVTYAMLCYLEKPSLLRGICLALAAVYTYSVHMRAVGVLAAVFVTVIVDAGLRLLSNREGKDADSDKKNLIYVLVIAVLLLVGFIICLNIKNNIIDTLYTSGRENRTAINDYSGQTAKLKGLFTLTGIKDFFLSLVGKILYLGCGTFGTAYIGAYYLIKRALKKDINAFFILLSAFLQFMVMCIFLIGSAGWDRFDLYLHGRYFDFCVPILTVLGIYDLLKENGYIKKVAVSAVVVILTGVASCGIAFSNTTGFSDPHGMLMIGMSYFLDEGNVQPVRTIIINCVFSIIIMCIMILLIAFYRKSKNVLILCLVHLFLLGLSYHACNHFIYIGQVYIYGDIQVADEIKALRQEGHEGDIVLLYEGGLEYIDTVQLRLRDEHISVVYADDATVLESVGSDDLVLVDFESKLNAGLSDRYEHSWESGHFDLYYNEAGGRK